MKRFVTILTLACLLAALCGCGNADPMAPLTAKQEARIQQDYFNYRKIDASYYDVTVVRIQEYYGTYHGCVAMMITGADGYAQSLTGEEVAGYVFRYNDAQKMLIWHAGSFYSLPDAFEQQLLNEQDVEAIWNARNDWRETQSDLIGRYGLKLDARIWNDDTSAPEPDQKPFSNLEVTVTSPQSKLPCVRMNAEIHVDQEKWPTHSIIDSDPVESRWNLPFSQRFYARHEDYNLFRLDDNQAYTLTLTLNIAGQRQTVTFEGTVEGTH